ncbi:MAG: ferredoxin family protein, partial [Armatimonadetes bacterium]|nr:ferredoxin family protein [Armatimonadota bacterium]
INPDECIDCGLCEPECPVDAIYAGDELPDVWQHYAEINAAFYATVAERTEPSGAKCVSTPGVRAFQPGASSVFSDATR